MEQKEPVILRSWYNWKTGEDYGTVALFPCDPADLSGRFCTSYQHVGQHSAANFEEIMGNSRPTSDVSMIQELTALGYNLEIVNNKTSAHAVEFYRRLRLAHETPRQAESPADSAGNG